MAIFTFKCTCGKIFEGMVNVVQDPLVCPECGAGKDQLERQWTTRTKIHTTSGRRDKVLANSMSNIQKMD